MNEAMIGSLLRHIGSIVAGLLLSRGMISEGHTEEIVGVIIAIGTMLWSQWQKKQQAAAVKSALYTEPPKP